MTPIKDALEKRLSELVDLVNTTNRVATRINGKFVLDRDKVIPFVLGGLFTTPTPGRDALRERIATAQRALRYLADHDRPQGGQSDFNAEHLHQIADDLSALPVAPVDGSWHDADAIPQIKAGSSQQYILAVYRKHSDKVYSFAAEYLNGYGLRYEWGCPKDNDGFCESCSEDGCPTTGWFVVEGAEDDGYTYQSLELKEGDCIKGWLKSRAGKIVPPRRSLMRRE